MSFGEIFTIILSGIIFIFMGAIVGWYISTKTDIMDKLLKKPKEMNKILNNPELLKEKLESNGTIIDDGEEIKYTIVKKNGKKVLDIKRVPYKK